MSVKILPGQDRPTKEQIETELRKYIAIRLKMERQGKAVSKAEREMQMAVNNRDRRLGFWQKTSSELKVMEAKLKSEHVLPIIQEEWLEYLSTHPDFFG